MIVDTFMFNDEFEMLDIRLEITKNYVDKWIILEGNKTWSGKSKSYLLQERIENYNKKYNNRIDLITLEIPINYKDWVCENYSRSSLQIGIDRLATNDIIIHSDLDEIINPEKLPFLLDELENKNKPISCQLEMFVYSFNLKTLRNWNGPVIAKKSMFENPQRLYKGSLPKRKDRAHCYHYPGLVGWHWTWIGNESRIKNKVISCIESQYRDPEQVLSSLKNGDTVSAINHKTVTEKIETSYPNLVDAIIKKYPYWS